jgi:VIT1/CCC1 family predicted Fe2+/Mn2+ transporter
MNREFPVSTGYKIFYAVIALGMFGLGALLLTERTPGSAAVYLFPLFFIIGGIGLIADKLKSNISIYSDSIVQTRLFKTKSIALADIKGFRIETKVFYIESATSKMTVRGYSELADYQGLLQWLRENYQDLDAADYKTDLQKILTDQSLGYTEDERKAALKKAKIFSFTYNTLGVVLFLVNFLIGHNVFYEGLLIVYPIIGIVILFTGKGLIYFYINKNSPYYSICYGVFAAIAAMFVKSMDNYYLLRSGHILPSFLIICAVFFLALKLTDPGKTATTMGLSSIFLFLVTGLAYGFGSFRLANCTFDRSSEQVFHASVINHSITHSKGTHYHIVIGPWGPQRDMESIDVSQFEYFQDTIGSVVNAHLKKGLLSIPWYTVSK